MYKYLTPLLITLLLSVATASAASIDKNQAVTMCKTYVKENIDGHTRSKLKDIKSKRKQHTVTLLVYANDDRELKKCVVSKADGEVSLKS